LRALLNYIIITDTAHDSVNMYYKWGQTNVSAQYSQQLLIQNDSLAERKWRRSRVKMAVST